jgi:hypothetical protein
MLRSSKDLFGYVLSAKDDDIGRCKDFLFDDKWWAVRYMVADTGKWLPKRKVLVSPVSLGQPDWSSHRFPIRLTKEQIESGPPLEHDAPLSRQYEQRYMDHFGFPHYWAGGALWGPSQLPMVPFEPAGAGEAATVSKTRTRPIGDGILRSMDEVTGYHIQATDDDVGHVEDFIVDDASWAIRYMVVDTRNWLPGRKVIVSPDWVDSVDWATRQVAVSLAKSEIKKSPKYDPATPINREYEAKLYDFYGRPHYW